MEHVASNAVSKVWHYSGTDSGAACVNMLLELGSHSGIQGPIKRILRAVGGAVTKEFYLSALLHKHDAVESSRPWT